MNEVPPAWRKHFDLMRHLGEDLPRNPFDSREPIQRIDADVAFIFSPEPDLRATISRIDGGHTIVVPIGAYLRLRLIALALSKSPVLRSIPTDFTGKPISDTLTHEIIGAMRSQYSDFSTLLEVVNAYLAAVGNEEPHRRVAVNQSYSECVAASAFCFLLIHETCHFWYGHYALLHSQHNAPEQQEAQLPPDSLMLAEINADIGAGTNAADVICADVNHYRIPSASSRYLGRIIQLGHISGIGIAMLLDLVEAIHYSAAVSSAQNVYRPYRDRLLAAGLGLRMHLRARLGPQSGGVGSIAFLIGAASYERCVGRPSMSSDELESEPARFRRMFEDVARLSQWLAPHVPNTPDTKAAAEFAGHESKVGLAQSATDDCDWDAYEAALHPEGIAIYTNTVVDDIPTQFLDYGAHVVETFSEPGAARQVGSGAGLLWDDRLDPFHGFHSSLTEAVASEIEVAAKIAEVALNRGLTIRPDRSPIARFQIAAEDPAFESFSISLSAGLTSRLGIVLRCMFDSGEDSKTRQLDIDDTEPDADRVGSEEGESLVACPKGTETRSELTVEDFGAGLGSLLTGVRRRERESYEARNGFRYGLLFVLFRCIAHVNRGHFDILERVADGDPQAAGQVRLGLSLDADVTALANTIEYAEAMAEVEVAEARRPDLAVLIRGMHLRAVFLGALGVLSCFDAPSWTGWGVRAIHCNPLARLWLATDALYRGARSLPGGVFRVFPGCPEPRVRLFSAYGEDPSELYGRTWPEFLKLVVGDWESTLDRLPKSTRTDLDMAFRSLSRITRRHLENEGGES